MIWNLKLHVAVELYKILRARLGRIVLITTFAGATVPIVLIGALNDKNVSTFPGVVTQLILPSLTVLLGIISVLMALASWGDEFEYGTVRTVLSRCPARGQFLLGKTIALAIALLVIIVLAVAAVVLVAVASHLIQIGSDGLGENLNPLARAILPIIAVWWLGGMVYTGVVTLATIGSQSPALGMAAGLGLFLADLLLGGLGLSGSNAAFAAYSIIDNSYGMITSILSDLFGANMGLASPEMGVMVFPEPYLALVRLLLYAAGTLALAYIFFEKQDIT